MAAGKNAEPGIKLIQSDNTIAQELVYHVNLQIRNLIAWKLLTNPTVVEALESGQPVERVTIELSEQEAKDFLNTLTVTDALKGNEEVIATALNKGSIRILNNNSGKQNLIDEINSVLTDKLNEFIKIEATHSEYTNKVITLANNILLDMRYLKGISSTISFPVNNLNVAYNRIFFMAGDPLKPLNEIPLRNLSDAIKKSNGVQRLNSNGEKIIRTDKEGKETFIAADDRIREGLLDSGIYYNKGIKHFLKTDKLSPSEEEENRAIAIVDHIRAEHPMITEGTIEDNQKLYETLKTHRFHDFVKGQIEFETFKSEVARALAQLELNNLMKYTRTLQSGIAEGFVKSGVKDSSPLTNDEIQRVIADLGQRTGRLLKEHEGLEEEKTERKEQKKYVKDNYANLPIEEPVQTAKRTRLERSGSLANAALHLSSSLGAVIRHGREESVIGQPPKSPRNKRTDSGSEIGNKIKKKEEEKKGEKRTGSLVKLMRGRGQSSGATEGGENSTIFQPDSPRGDSCNMLRGQPSSTAQQHKNVTKIWATTSSSNASSTIGRPHRANTLGGSRLQEGLPGTHLPHTVVLPFAEQQLSSSSENSNLSPRTPVEQNGHESDEGCSSGTQKAIVYQDIEMTDDGTSSPSLSESSPREEQDDSKTTWVKATQKTASTTSSPSSSEPSPKDDSKITWVEATKKTATIKTTESIGRSRTT